MSSCPGRVADSVGGGEPVQLQQRAGRRRHGAPARLAHGQLCWAQQGAARCQAGGGGRRGEEQAFAVLARRDSPGFGVCGGAWQQGAGTGGAARRHGGREAARATYTAGVHSLLLLQAAHGQARPPTPPLLPRLAGSREMNKVSQLLCHGGGWGGGLVCLRRLGGVPPRGSAPKRRTHARLATCALAWPQPHRRHAQLPSVRGGRGQPLLPAQGRLLRDAAAR